MNEELVPITVHYGLANQCTVWLSEEITIHKLLSLAPLREILGYNNNVRVLVDRVEHDFETRVGKHPLTIVLETYANRKAGMPKREFLKRLARLEETPCKLIPSKGPHEIWQPAHGKEFILSRGSGDVPDGIVRRILRQRGFDGGISKFRRQTAG